MKFLRSALPHIALALTLGLMVLCVLDSFNPTLAFLSSSVSKLYILITCVFIVAVCLACILRDRE